VKTSQNFIPNDMVCGLLTTTHEQARTKEPTAKITPLVAGPGKGSSSWLMAQN
jgi:hypothetical protein